MFVSLLPDNLLKVNKTQNMAQKVYFVCMPHLSYKSKKKTWTLWKVDQKYMGSFEMWCWRRMEISWADHVRTEEVLQRVKEKRISLQTIKRRKANGIGHILPRNCLLKHIIEGKIEGKIEVTEG
jgi:hypothetical protein